MKTHLLRPSEWRGWTYSRTTLCGLVGWPAPHVGDEYDTALGKRFDAVEIERDYKLPRRKVCGSCLRSRALQ